MVAILAGGQGKLAEAVEDYFLSKGIRSVILKDGKKRTAVESLSRILGDDVPVKLVILAGYKRIIPSSIHREVPTINCHPTILPCGKGLYGEKAIVYSLEHNCTGFTVHYVNDEIDSGEIITKYRIDPIAKEAFISVLKSIEREEYPKVCYNEYKQILSAQKLK